MSDNIKLSSCEECGKEFSYYASKRRNPRYCTKPCYHQARRKNFIPPEQPKPIKKTLNNTLIYGCIVLGCGLIMSAIIMLYKLILSKGI